MDVLAFNEGRESSLGDGDGLRSVDSEGVVLNIIGVPCGHHEDLVSTGGPGLIVETVVIVL